MKFSIVTISYNQAEYLEKTITSVLEQKTTCDIEYIVVDPGSTDGSLKIIERYGDCLDHVITEQDRGPADGLNAGFKYATGEFFGYVNSDDYLLPGAIDSVRLLFARNSEADVICGAGLVVDSDGKILRKCFSDSMSLFRSAYGASVIIQPSTFFRGALFRQCGGFNINNKSNWDGELMVDMALRKAKFLSTTAELSAYRVHPAGITGSGRLATLHAEHSARMFQKIFQRPMTRADEFLGKFVRTYKHLSNPTALLERVRRGPIFAREKIDV